ncbi:MAG: 3-hydroxybutyryl-CoA dehydratase / 3-hydroxyacyl-CoA dehydrogenase [Frankiales bacterium]|nr:3-hydroxybutyryl-CoA dehydratase / 3-hydroxyacyl-CoA dehydrogenase [Frankiales bacterium]
MGATPPGTISLSSDDRTVLLSVADGVATVSLNRPHRHNAVDDEMHHRFDEVWAEAAADPDSRVILLRGEGPSFCSGRDMAQLGERPGGESDLAFMRRHQASRIAQLDCPKPVIAAVRGHVLGGGLEIALAADIRIGASDLRMAFPEIRYGLMTDTGGLPMSTLLIGPARAKWLLMTGAPVTAERALAWGLVDDVVAPEDLDATAQALAREIAEKPADALAMIKSTVDSVFAGAVRGAMATELIAQAALFGSDDYRARKAARAGRA